MADKYSPLTSYLRRVAARGQEDVEVSFADLDALVGGLPPSAHSQRSWWANSSHSQALAWRDAGFHVGAVSLHRKRVRFERGSVGGSRQGTARTTAPASRSAARNPAPPAVDEPVTVTVTVQWHAAGGVRLDAAGKPAFPPMPDRPGLYRLTLSGASLERPQRYVGETDNLHRRLHSNYRTPGPSQQTSLRINALLRGHLAADGHVDLAVITAATVVLVGEHQPLDLTRKAGRLLAENAVLVDAYRRNDAEIVNLG